MTYIEPNNSVIKKLVETKESLFKGHSFEDNGCSVCIFWDGNSKVPWVKITGPGFQNVGETNLSNNGNFISEYTYWENIVSEVKRHCALEQEKINSFINQCNTIADILEMNRKEFWDVYIFAHGS